MKRTATCDREENMFDDLDRRFVSNYYILKLRAVLRMESWIISCNNDKEINI